MIREIHGIADAGKCTMGSPDGKDRQDVTVENRPGIVVLKIANDAYPAALTPEQARMIAKHLIKAADRAERDK